MKIEDLPDFAAIRQIVDALWRRRATVFVGAGFSLNAVLASPHTAPPPLWRDLAKTMLAKLYGADHKLAPADPLKLAEEYRALFGQAALDDFVRDQILDTAWTPGAAHLQLLELPWSDVLTTNYDTLLERAGQEINEFSYEAVNLESDLTHARAPRIVKLHGSIGTSDHFVIAEEDYRAYPAQHAAFVNFARQSFVENELCLLGFSGDDPNFLQWSGWVRDHLGSSTRRIYLIGLLKLSAAKRKYLEVRNIAPIDLAPLVADLELGLQQGNATDRFLDYLHNAKPKPVWDWAPASPPRPEESADDPFRTQRDPSAAAIVYRSEVVRWRKERETYPGWLICPQDLWRPLSQHHAPDWPTAANLKALSEEERAAVLFEYVWRKHTSLRRLDPEVAKLAAPFADPGIICGLSKTEQLALAVILASHARFDDDDSAFDRWISVIETHAPEGGEERAEAAYQRALQARDRRDLATVDKLVNAIRGRDPAWGLRRASLRVSAGDVERAQADVAETLAELRRRQRQDRESVWIMSRRAWAAWLARVLERNQLSSFTPWTEEFRISHCDPWELCKGIADDLREAVEKQRLAKVRRPRFEPGNYDDPSRTVHMVSDMTGPEHTFRRLVEDAGVPIHLELVDVLGDQAKDIAALTDRAKTYDWLRLVSMLRGRSDPIVESAFGRVAVAAAPAGIRVEVVAALYREIAFWRGRLGANQVRWSSVQRLGLLIELLARFSLCADSGTAEIAYVRTRDWVGPCLPASLVIGISGQSSEVQLGGHGLQQARRLDRPNARLSDASRSGVSGRIALPTALGVASTSETGQASSS
ncbi:MAG TPA: SIR2 family protein [Caulobacteraceae bacterium]|jgi:hypothetical protein|nr:SIR2 family protein [Caulobacteraceae bacterium]